MTALLEARGLKAFYGDAQALFGVDFSLSQGELVAVIGSNGAGKSTLLKCLTGLVRAPREAVHFKGEAIGGLPPGEIVKRGLAMVPEGRRLFASLSVEENLLLLPRVRSGGMTVDEVYKLFPNLQERRKSQGTRLSGGEQQMLALGRILLTGAEILLLDEITEGLAPVIVQLLGKAIAQLKERGYTIVLVEQNFQFASQLADRHYVMEHGRILEMIRKDELASRMDSLHQQLGV
jgi:branched-chain amino acid transport system ATP-binding protein